MNFSLSVCRHNLSKIMMATFNLTSFTRIQVHSSCWESQDWSTSTSGSGFPSLSFVALAGNSVLLYLISMERNLHEPMFFFLSMQRLQISSCLTHVYPKHSASSGQVLRKSAFLDVLLRCFFTIALPWILPPCWLWHLFYIAILLPH